MRLCIESLESIEEKWRPTRRIDYTNIFRISAKNNTNVDELCLTIREIIDQEDELKRFKKQTKKSNESDDDDTDYVPV